MDSATAQAIAEATPLGGIPAPEAATPQIEAQAEVAGEQQPPAAIEDEWIELPDPENPGAMYTRVPKDPIKMAKWVIDRNRDYSKVDREKARLEAENQLLRQMGQQPQPAAPQPAVNGVNGSQDPDVVALANELFAEYRVQYDAEPEQIYAAALRDAKVQVTAERRVMQQIEAREAKTKNETIVNNNPVLRSDFGQSIFEKYGGRMTAETHLALVKLEAMEQGVDLSAFGLKPALSQTTKASVQNGVAARTAALSAPAAQAAAAPNVAKPPDPGLFQEYQRTIATGNYTEEQKTKLWTLMQQRYDQRKGAA